MLYIESKFRLLLHSTVKFEKDGLLRTRQKGPTYAKSDLHVSRIFSVLHVAGYFPM